MEINATQYTPFQGAPAVPSHLEDALGKNDFLMLLVAQMKNQDPLNPMDGTEFTAQLAQFSSLEQLQNLNAGMDLLQAVQMQMVNTQAVGYIGKTVTAQGNTVELAGGQADTFHYDLEGDAAEVTLYIYNAGGQLIRTVDLGAQGEGGHDYQWDGADEQSLVMPDGTYIIDVLALDGENNMVKATSYITGEVTGVDFVGGQTILLLGEQQVPLWAVLSVTMPEPEPEGDDASEDESEAQNAQTLLEEAVAPLPPSVLEAGGGEVQNPLSGPMPLIVID